MNNLSRLRATAAKFRPLTLALLGVALVQAGPARAAVIYSIAAPGSVAAGSTGNILEIVLTNSLGSPDISVAGFTFGIESSDPGVTFTSADFFTTDTYIFDGNSFFGGMLDNGPGTSMTGGDLSGDGSGTTVTGTAGGNVFGLARVLFDVDPSVTGSIIFSFISAPGNEPNSLSKPATSTPPLAITIDQLNGATTLVTTTAAIPEPSTTVLAGAALLAAAGGGAWRRRRRAG